MRGLVMPGGMAPARHQPDPSGKSRPTALSHPMGRVRARAPVGQVLKAVAGW
ncbi:hypothetical protein K2X14_10935 [Acetobacter sp. TBRC 12305]|uniref:Uncharacterized protein n=1 Tax=Acetobacter garciniae TaxID=2817435 RepID=A0A939HPM5_9PROT|nr:hypothetical protein [Acetobacter garciniae]MBO1325477.1 hypothetical protein [Acetobacter garciniae]MBX0345351.1 hypothetical protein [Acetobacter garciniae]